MQKLVAQNLVQHCTYYVKNGETIPEFYFSYSQRSNYSTLIIVLDSLKCVHQLLSYGL